MTIEDIQLIMYVFAMALYIIFQILGFIQLYDDFKEKNEIEKYKNRFYRR